MKKLLFILICLLVAPSVTRAQGPAPTLSPDRVWVHLEPQLCSDVDAHCSIAASAPHASRRIKLTVPDTEENGSPIPSDEKLVPESDTFLFECIATNIGSVCTSNVKEIDMQLYGEDRSEVLNSLFLTGTPTPTPPGTCGAGYAFEGLFNSQGAKISQPVSSTTNGEFENPLEWQSCSPVVQKEFLALNYADPNRIKNLAGNLGGQQQTQIPFEVAKPTAPPAVGSGRVANVRRRRNVETDPYGRVFDATTLEPISGAVLVLTRQRMDGTFTKVNPYDPNDVVGGSIINPYTTKNDGYFNFIVPDGTYRLELPPELNKDYVIATNPALLNVKYANIYSDIYPLYSGVNIVQRGKIEHRDIPVVSKKPVFQTPQLTAYFHDLNKTTGVVTINGKTNLPFLHLKLLSVTLDDKTGKPADGRIIAEDDSGKDGAFYLEFNASSFEKGETYGKLELSKNSIYAIENDKSKKVNITINPILNFIQGYAKDKSGNNMPYAKVGVYLPLSKQAYYETTADAKGYYAISSENLPPFSYSLIFSTPTGITVEATTMDMALGNRENNLFGYTRLKPVISSQKKSSVELPGNEKKEPITPANQPTYVALIVVVILLIVGGVFTFAVFLRKRKGQVPPDMPNI